MERDTILETFLSESLKTNDFNLLPLAGDASSRRYYRAVVGEDSWVLMSWEPFGSAKKFPFINIQAHWHEHGVRVPSIINYDPANGLILLEDLGDLTLERKFWETQQQETVIPFYKAAIDQLIKVHFLCTSDKDQASVAHEVQFDEEKFMWELNYGYEHLFEKLMELRPGSEQKTKMKDLFQDVARRLDREPKYICHRDFHSRNVMIKLDKVYLIDFQDARLGPLQYDLVSLLHDTYVSLSKETRNQLLSYYCQLAQPYLNEVDVDHFYRIYNLQLIQRSFKACGSFASFYNQRGDTRYLKYIHTALKEVLLHLDDFPEYSEFSQFIIENELLEKSQDLP